MKNIKIIGSGFYGCTIARLFADNSIPVTIIESRECLGGNSASYFDSETGIEVHKYGSHIFHTQFDDVWNFVNRFSKFNQFQLHVIARHNDESYYLPFNISIYEKLFRRQFTPILLKEFMENSLEKKQSYDNLEDKAISLVGKEIYEAFIKNYTWKQWNKNPKELDLSIITRLPVRTTYNTNYFNDKYQGIPLDGYCRLFENLVDDSLIKVELNRKYSLSDLEQDKDSIVIYTGSVDELLDYRFGELEWRSLRFENKILNIQDFLGNAIVNYTDRMPEYTRIHEYKHYHLENPEVFNSSKTFILYEYPLNWKIGIEKYYPVNNETTEKRYSMYVNYLKLNYSNVFLGGRLGLYRYFDMDKTIKHAIDDFRI